MIRDMRKNQSPLENNKSSMLDSVLLFLILIYQKFISPIKGFKCAHYYEHGGLSCSDFVKQTIKRRGVLYGLTVIQSRFNACRSAAALIRSRGLRDESGFLDCAPDACSDFGSCGDFGGGGGAGGDTGSSKSATVIFIPFSFLLIVILLVGFNFFEGPQIDHIEIRLLEGQVEIHETGIAKLVGGDLPDYQVIFDVDGRQVTTNTLDNSSAKEWITLTPKRQVDLSDVRKITIVNKQVLKDEILDSVISPEAKGSGEKYQYRIIEAGGFF